MMMGNEDDCDDSGRLRSGDESNEWSEQRKGQEKQNKSDKFQLKPNRTKAKEKGRKKKERDEWNEMNGDARSDRQMSQEQPAQMKKTWRWLDKSEEERKRRRMFEM